MKKAGKIMAMGLATVISMSAMNIGIFAYASENDIVYSYIDENNQEINITQEDLDAGHWNRYALGDTAPLIYENFPMSMTSFVNDFAELKLNFVYMKNIEDMDTVELNIKDLSNESVIYDETISEVNFYSPILQAGKNYEVTLSETIEGITNEYVKVVMVKKVAAEMPDYVTNPSQDSENKILIADVDVLRQGQSVNEQGQIVIDPTIAKYEKIPACDFQNYCQTLSNDKIYRVFANDGRQYSGFYSNANGGEIYDLTIEVYNWEDITSISPMSLPSAVTIDDVVSTAVVMGLQDKSFRLRETSTSAKYEAYELWIPYSSLNDEEDDELQNAFEEFQIKITGTSQIAAKIWVDEGTDNPRLIKTSTSLNNENVIDFTIDLEYYNQAVDYMVFYVMVYFTGATEGYGMISFDDVSGYTDDVTGSIFEAYNGLSAYLNLPNTEFTLTDTQDVDVFCIDYWGTNEAVFKVEIKNRSLEDQAELESGHFVQGSSEKILSLLSVEEEGAVLTSNVESVYTVPRNTDLVVYASPTHWGHRIVSISTDMYFIRTVPEEYQLSITQMQD